MITIHLTAQDRAQIRFAFSPMWEVLMSYRARMLAAQFAVHLPWLREAEEALRGVALPYLDGLLRPGAFVRGAYIPDFFTPTPDTPLPLFEAELDVILATSPQQVRDNIRLASKQATSPIFQHYLDDPQQALVHLVEDIKRYWDLTLAHHWEKMQAILDGDVIYRARQLTLEGPDALFNDLHPLVSYEDSVVYVDTPLDEENTLDGGGLILVPTIFGWSDIVVSSKSYAGLLAYGARGAGRWNRQVTPPDEALEAAVGSSRARILSLLITPGSNGEIAAALNITGGAVSQQMNRLQHAGLVEPNQIGKRVYYHLTQRGDALVKLFDNTDTNER